VPTYKISQLTTATAVSATNQFEINQNGTSKSVEVSVIDVYIKSISNLPVVVSVSSASNALRITQTGTGNALLVEDSANPDATPFVIDASGNVGIGTSSPDALLTVNTIASFGAGAAALPSIAAKGDLNTGLWFPAADTIAASTGGSERLRITSTGNVGIGTNSPAYTFDINSITGWGANQTAPIANIVGANAPTNGGGNLRVLSNTSATADAGGSLVLGGYYTAQTNSIDYAEISGRKQTGQTTGGYLALSTRADLGNETERLRITSSGNVGIGTSSPSQKLEVYATSNSLQIESVVRNDQAGSGVAAIGFNVSSGAAAEATSTKAGIGLVRSNAYGVGSLCFYNNATSSAGDFTTADERMRIDTSGTLSIGTTNDLPGFSNNVSGVALQANGTSCFSKQGNITTVINNGASGQTLTQYNYQGTLVGQVVLNGTTGVLYQTASDYRLKHDVQPLIGGLTTIGALKPTTYKWNADNSYGEGFIAHELQAVIPQAVSGEKDAINKDGSIKSQGVDYSKIVVHLVAAIQELSAKVAILEAKQ